MVVTGLIRGLDARDRALYRRSALGRDATRLARSGWIAITHLGSAPVTIGAGLLPLLLGPSAGDSRWLPGLALAVSHVVIQVLKRLVCRERPSVRFAERTWIPCPDRFSFPSGHSASALAIALGYAALSPALGIPLIGLALVVGWSRVRLGVHYPGDVVAGQLIATVTVLLIR